MTAERSVTGVHRGQLERIALVVIVAAAAVTRFAWLKSVELKEDEADACRLAQHVLRYSDPGGQSITSCPPA